MAIARAALLRAFSTDAAAIADTPEGPQGKITVCATIRVRGAVRGCWPATANSLPAAIESSVRQTLRDPRAEWISRAELGQARLEVWIQESRRVITAVLPRHLWGSHGLEVREGDRSAFYLPYVAVESESRDPDELLERLYGKARLWSAGSRESSQLFETEWTHIVEGKQSARRFFRLRADGPQARPSLVQMAAEAGRHLLNIQRFDGSYIYQYDPLRGKPVETETSIVRIILPTYSLARFAAHLVRSSDADYPAAPFLEGAERGLSFIRRHLVASSDGVHFRDDQGEALLGSTALSLLAFAYFPDSTATSDVMPSLTNAVLKSQNQEGWFPNEILRADQAGQQDFAPGQAILALLKQNSRPLEDILPALEKAFSFYSRRPIEQASRFFLAWQCKAWCEMWRRTRKYQYAELAFRLLDQLATFQMSPAEDCPSDFVGGYRANADQTAITPPTFLVSLFTEAAVLGWHVAIEIGDHSRAAFYRQIVLRGIDCMFRLQVSEDQHFIFVDPQLAVGGLRRDLASFQMRCDYAAHALTCLTTAIELGLS
jgi:AMMECR1 domain-containing protein